MRSELEVPFQFSSIGIDGKNTGGVKVVTGPRVRKKVGCRIAGGPIQGVEFRIVRARHPGGGATMQVGIPGPTFGPEFSRAGDHPQPPLHLSRRCVIGGNKPAHS